MCCQCECTQTVPRQPSDVCYMYLGSNTSQHLANRNTHFQTIRLKSATLPQPVSGMEDPGIGGRAKEKRPRKTFAAELPPMGLHFCVGDHAVPTFRHEDFEDLSFVKVMTSRNYNKDNNWLLKGLGIDSFADLPHDNVLKRMRMAIEASRGKRTKMVNKVDQQGQAQSSKLTIRVDAHDIEVINIFWPIQFLFSEDNVKWLVNSLHEDLRRAQHIILEECSQSETEGKEEKVTDQIGEPEIEVMLRSVVQKMDHDSLPLGCSWSPAKKSYVAGNKGLKRMNFRVRVKVIKKGSEEDMLEELQLQRHRADHYLQTHVVLPCPDDS